MKSWVRNEINHCEMADARLTHRLGTLLNNLGDKPHRSIPAANNSWAEVQATYRFLDNDRVNFDDIFSGHRSATQARLKNEDIVLIPQDTTFFNFARYAKKKGMGTLKQKESDQQLLHVSLALNPQRVNLGVVNATSWKRPEKDAGYHRRKVKTQDKESYRWLTHFECACDIQSKNPDKTIVSIADREGDIHEWFLAAEDTPLERQAAYIIRAKSNRRVEEEDGSSLTLWERFKGNRPLGSYTLLLPARQNQSAREALLNVYIQTVQFVGRQGSKRTPVEVNVVYVKEKHPPKGVEGIEWMLLTNLEVEDFAQAETVIEWYGIRWEIEVFFKVLKNGSQVEQLRLENEKRLMNCIAVYLIVSWRLHNITMFAREMPEVSCDTVYSKIEWQTIVLLRDKKKPPKKPPTLYEITRKLAMLGGFIGRTGDGEPGVKTIWVGYQRLMQSVETLQTLKFAEEK